MPPGVTTASSCDAEIESIYVDTHGAIVVAFAFTDLLNFRLPPRLKNIGSI
jgi:TnpA family transposase